MEFKLFKFIFIILFVKNIKILIWRFILFFLLLMVFVVYCVILVRNFKSIFNVFLLGIGSK